MIKGAKLLRLTPFMLDNENWAQLYIQHANTFFWSPPNSSKEGGGSREKMPPTLSVWAC